MGAYLWLLPLGLVVGLFGTLVGAGGGFLLVPILLLMYPQEAPEIITSVSLGVVFFNALSGSVAYARMKRVDFKSGLAFASTAIPGAIAGALMTSLLPRRLFDACLGVLMCAASVYLAMRPQASVPGGPAGEKRRWQRVLIDRNGTRYEFSYRLSTGLLLSFVVSFISSLLGIGGGIMHVPGLVKLLGFPIHLATATSHFMLAIVALTGTLVHVCTGSFHHGVRRMAILSVGVVIGAQLGAKLSDRFQGQLIIRLLAGALALVGLRIVWLALA